MSEEIQSREEFFRTRNEGIAFDYQNNMRVEDIAAKWKVSALSVPALARSGGYVAGGRTRGPHMPHKNSEISERNKKICDQYNEGHSLETVGEAFGITRERVRQILVASGVTERHGGFLSPHQIEARAKAERADVERAARAEKIEARKAKKAEREAKVRELYDAGKTYDEIASALSISKGCVQKDVWVTGRPSRNRAALKPKNRLSDETRDIIARRYFAGEHVRLIADEYDIYPELVSRIARALGFFRKPPRKNGTKAIAVASTMRDGS